MKESNIYRYLAYLFIQITWFYLYSDTVSVYLIVVVHSGSQLCVF